MLDDIYGWLQQYADFVWPYVETVWNAFGDYAWLRAALIAAVSYFIARLLSRHIPELLEKITDRFHLMLGKEILDLSRFPIFNLLFLSGLLIAVNISGFTEAVSFAFKAILKSTMIAVFALFVYRLSKLFLGRAANSDDRKSIIQPQTLPLFNNTVLVFVLVGALHQIFAVWNIDMTALLASAGIVGLAIGMASKDMLSDVIAGILILTDGPYRINDFIEVNDRERRESLKGWVTQIGIRTTRVLTKDNVEVIVPNSLMNRSRIINESSAKEPGLRIKLHLTTACGVESDQIRAILLDVARQSSDVMQDKPIVIQLLEFDKRCATFRLLCWIADETKQSPIKARLSETIYKRFMQENIPLALPEREEVTIKEMPDTRQEVAITAMPNEPRTLHVKEIPNLFAPKVRPLNRNQGQRDASTSETGKETSA